MYGSLCTRRDARETRDVRGGIDCVVSIEAGEENMEVSSKARRPTCLIGRAMKNKSINTFEAKRFFLQLLGIIIFEVSLFVLPQHRVWSSDVISAHLNSLLPPIRLAATSRFSIPYRLMPVKPTLPPLLDFLYRRSASLR